MTVSVQSGFDFKRLGTSVRWGSFAFYRKVATQDARLQMAEIIKAYEKLIRGFKDISPAACEEALRPVFKRAQYYVPEDTGNLWASGKLTSGTKNGKAYANITFGNEEAPYAAIVHEFVWLHHESPTRAKYLQAAMEEQLNDLLPRLQTAYQRQMNV